MVKKHHVGQIYRRHGEYYLAIAPQRFMTCRAGRVRELRPLGRYLEDFDITVSELRARWGLSAEAFDAVVARYFQPRPLGLVSEERAAPIKVVRVLIPSRRHKDWRAAMASALRDGPAVA